MTEVRDRKPEVSKTLALGSLPLAFSFVCPLFFALIPAEAQQLAKVVD
jgi:hypothetical protein